MNPDCQVPSPSQPAPRRPGDVRWRALALTAALVILGGLLLEFYDRLPDLSAPLRQSIHVEAKTKVEVDVRFRQGVAMLQAREYEHALTAFHRVLQLAPKMPEAHVNAGFALLGMGRAKAAYDFFNGATELRPDQVNAYYGMGEALAALGDTFGALQAMETYIHRAPKDDPFRAKAQAAVWELRAKINEEKGMAAADVRQLKPAKP